MENDTDTVKARTTPKDFFLNLGWLLTLYGSVIALLNTVFGVIDQAFPDAVNAYYVDYTGGIRSSPAWLIIIFPIFLVLSLYVRRMFLIDPSRREVWVRRWFVYLTLFLSSVTAVVDIIVLLNSFLNGELTSKFVLKVAVILAVAVAVFAYYFIDLKKESIGEMAAKAFAIGSVAAVVASIVWAFAVIGSPMAQRERRFDQERVNDLQSIQYQVINYWQAKGKLPSSLADLSDSISGYSAPADPENGTPFQYQATGKADFRLCANFDLSSMPYLEPYPSGYAAPQVMGPSGQWDHKAGNVCFSRSIDTALYPVSLKISPVSPVR